MSSSDKTVSVSNGTINHWMIKSYGVGDTPKELWESACRYFMWCEKNPIEKQEMIKQTGAIVINYVPRPFNLAALCVHLGVSPQYINDCARNKDSGDYQMVAQRILAVIYAQKYEYAVAGIFNAVLVGKDLGFDKGEQLKSAAVINISIDKSGPPLITNEQDVKL